MSFPPVEWNIHKQILKITISVVLLLLQRHNSKIFAPEFPFWPPFCITRHPFFFNIIFYNKANCSLSFFPQHKERIRGESSEQEKKKLTKYVEWKKKLGYKSFEITLTSSALSIARFLYCFFYKCIRLLFAWHSELKSKKNAPKFGRYYLQSDTKIFFREIDGISRIFFVSSRYTTEKRRIKFNFTKILALFII